MLTRMFGIHLTFSLLYIFEWKLVKDKIARQRFFALDCHRVCNLSSPVTTTWFLDRTIFSKCLSVGLRTKWLCVMCHIRCVIWRIIESLRLLVASSQPVFTCSKSEMKTAEQCMKCFQSVFTCSKLKKYLRERW